DMKFRDLALSECHESDAREAQVLIESCDILLVARQTVQSLGDHDVKAASTRILEQLLIAGAKPDRAADGMIAVRRDHLPALDLDARLAGTPLVFDRGLTLHV